MHSVILTELSTKSDLKAVIGAMSNVLNISKKEAVEKAKKLSTMPIILAENLPEKEAQLMADMFSGMGAGIKVNPPLGGAAAPPPQRELRELKTELPKRGIPLGCLLFIMLCLIGFATFASLNYEWIMGQVELQLKPSPEKSEKLLKKGNMKQAKKSIQKQLKEKPNDIELLVLQGRYYMSAARKRMDSQHWDTYGKTNALPELDTAVAIFRKAESLDPKDGNIPRWISMAEQLRRALPEAETAARRAVALNPAYVDNWNQLGSVFIDEEQISQAEQAFYRALKIDQTNATTLKNLTVLNLYYRQDAQKATNFLFNYLNQAEAVADMDSYKLRVDLTTEMFNDFNPPLERLSPPSLPFEEYEKRRKQITEDPQLKTDPLLQEQLGLLYMSKGKRVAAEDCFIKAIHLNAGMEPSRKMLAIMYLKEKNYEKALQTMLAAVDNGAKDLFFWKNIGFLQKYFKANPEEANKAFNRYLAFGGDSYLDRVKKEVR
jgi:tetratricopeptide (TPR) repeat protein